MKYLVVLALTALMVACTGQARVTPAALQGGVGGAVANAAGSAGQTTVLPTADPNSGRICKTVKRPGSNIADTVCYTREQQLARQAAGQEAVDDLQNEQRWRDQSIHEAAMKNRYPTGVGILQ